MSNPEWATSGPLDKSNDVNHFVLGPAKCGTLSMYRSIEKCTKEQAIHLHSTDTIKRVHGPNMTLLDMINTRLSSNPKDMYIYTSYREPISRSISQYLCWNQSNASTCTDIINPIIKGSGFMSKHYTESSHDYFFTMMKPLINIFEYNFDHDKGYLHIKKDNLNWIIYTLESCSKLENYLNEIFPGFHYQYINKGSYRNMLTFQQEDIDKIYDDPYVKYFYSEQQIKDFKMNRLRHTLG